MVMSESQTPQDDGTFYKPGQHPSLPPPPGTVGVIGWLRENLFSGPFNSLATIIVLGIVYMAVVPALNWMVFDSVTTGTDRRFCDLGRSASLIGQNASEFNANDFQLDPKAAGLSEADAAKQTLLKQKSTSSVTNVIGLIGAFNGHYEKIAADNAVPAGLIPIVDQVQPLALRGNLEAALKAGDVAGIETNLAALQPLASWGNGWDGACWVVIKQRYMTFLVGFYDRDQVWRPALAFVLLLVAIAPLLFDGIPLRRQLLWFSLIFPVIAYFLLVGNDNIPGLPLQETDTWGGLLATMVTGVVGISASLPIGIVLALGRRSKLPIVRALCVCFIEFIRGVPLITILFMSSVMLPLFLPEGVTFDKLLRALIGVALFASAYMAEVVRGGLQAIPKGQYEAAEAMGLTYWKSMRLIILPQALKIVIPGIVNTFIGLFKDTTLLGIIGILDLLAVAKATNTDAGWIGFFNETYFAVGLGFFIFCFGMSRYSIYLENKLHTGHKR